MFVWRGFFFDEGDMGRTVLREPLAADEAAAALPWREKLLESLADTDDAILRAYLGGETIAETEIHRALRAATPPVRPCRYLRERP